MALTEKYVSSSGTGTWGDASSSGTPCSLATAVANAAGGDRVNVKADGTYTKASGDYSLFAGDWDSPAVWRGYSSTIGDGYQGRNADGTLNTTNMPYIEFTSTGGQWIPGARIIFECIQFHTTACTAAAGFIDPSSNTSFIQCKFTGSGAGGASAPLILSGSWNSYIGCDIIDSRTSSRAALQIPGSCLVAGCRIKNVNGTTAIYSSSDMGAIWRNLIYDSAIGVETTGNNGRRLTLIQNTITGHSGNGVTLSNHGAQVAKIIGNLITDNGGYGIEDLYTTGASVHYFNNRFDRNTSGAISSPTDWPQLDQDISSVTEAQEYTDAAGEDWTLASTSPAEDNAQLPNTNQGYWQHAAAAPPSAGNLMIGLHAILHGKAGAALGLHSIESGSV